MAEIHAIRRAWIRWSLIVLAAAALLQLSSPRVAADTIVMFTASTDYTGNVPDGGHSYPNDPTQQNPNLPAISGGVTLSPASGGLSNTMVGALPDGTTYGPSGFNQNAGGKTPWVTSCYTFAAAGTFQFVWEVADLTNSSQGGDALVTDNITLTRSNVTSKIAQFQPGQPLPSGYTGLGSFGTSGSVTGLSPSGGDPGFAYMDVQPSTNTGRNPIFDTSGDVDSASRLYSAEITVKAGDMLCLDVAFLTSDGSPFNDYGMVVLQSVPEPSGVVLAAAGLLGAAACAARRRRAPASRG